MNEKNQTFPNALQALMLVLALFLVEYLIGAALYDVRGILSMEPGDLVGLVMVLGYGIVFTVLMQYKGLTYSALFHACASSRRATMLVLFPAIGLLLPLIYLAMTVLGWALVSLFPMTAAERAMLGNMHAGSVTMAVLICVLAPVLEEMLFRGIILRSFLAQYPTWAAILASAGLFGFVHLNIYQYVGAVFMGLLLGWLYERTRSLLPCIALHAAYNTACITLGAGDGAAGQENVWMFGAATWLLALLMGAAGMTILWRALHIPSSRRGV